MNSSVTNQINLFNNTIIYIYKYIVPLFYVVSNIGNLLSTLIFSKKSWKKNVCAFYFKIYILFSSCYINSSILASIFIYGYNIQLHNTNVVLCKIYYYVAYVFSTLTPTVLILASIDRLLISSQNVNTRLYSSKRLAYFSISLSTIIWSIFTLHILIKVNIQEYPPSVFICYYDSSQVYINFVFYFFLLCNVLVYLLMIILSIFAFKNIRHIHTIPRQQRNQIRTMTKKDFQLLRCLFAQDIIFIVLTVWVNISYTYLIATKDQFQTPLVQAIITFLNDLFSFFYDISYCANFFTFIVISKAFRHELKRLIFKIFGKHLMPIREEEHVHQNVAENVLAVNGNSVLPN